MRKVFAFITVLFCLNGYTQDNQFKIIKVKGGINNKSTNLLLKQGDQVGQRIPIQFLSKQSEAFAIIKGKGIYSISKQFADVFSIENSYVIQDVAELITDNIQLNIRSASNEFCFNSVDFNNINLYIIGDSTSLCFSPKIYPLNDKNYISFEYTVNGQDFISNPKINDQNIFLKRDLFKSTKIDTINNVNIMYYNSLRNSLNKEASLSILFLDKTVLKKELTLLYEDFKSVNSDRDYLSKNLRNYFFSVYGLTNGKELDEMIIQITNL
jgi:hypothetical protein